MIHMSLRNASTALNRQSFVIAIPSFSDVLGTEFEKAKIVGSFISIPFDRLVTSA
ncbi:MAG: hypothetical protein GTO14_11365 [Anaerolineales bacterium]|nr:hypothetical protein [Anaerolineales bacterium]